MRPRVLICTIDYTYVQNQQRNIKTNTLSLITTQFEVLNARHPNMLLVLGCVLL